MQQKLILYFSETKLNSVAIIAFIQVKNNTVSVLLGTGNKKVQVGKDQEKAQSEKDSHSKNQGGKKPN